MNNQEKGLIYERYVKDFIIQKIGKNAFLWNECPENILIENALVHSAGGHERLSIARRASPVRFPERDSPLNVCISAMATFPASLLAKRA